MAKTVKLGQIVMGQGCERPDIVYNTYLGIIDAAVSPWVWNATQQFPPFTPSEGDSYMINTPAFGDWAGREGQFAVYHNGLWWYIVPKAGFLFCDKSNTDGTGGTIGRLFVFTTATTEGTVGVSGSGTWGTVKYWTVS